MQEISKEDLRRGLLAYGMFADKLPAIFTAKSFYDYCEGEGFPTFENKGRDYVRYESTRKHERDIRYFFFRKKKYRKSNR